MLKLNIANLVDGQFQHEVTVQPGDLNLDNTDEFKSPIDVAFDVEKIGRNIFINLTLETKISLFCDRCAEEFVYALAEKLRLIYIYDHQFVEKEEDDVFVVEKSTSIIDVKEPIRQTCIVSVPYKKLCNPDCKGLCPSCGANLNRATCGCKVENIDPRWEKLKRLL